MKLTGYDHIFCLGLWSDSYCINFMSLYKFHSSILNIYVTVKVVWVVTFVEHIPCPCLLSSGMILLI